MSKTKGSAAKVKLILIIQDNLGWEICILYTLSLNNILIQVEKLVNYTSLQKAVVDGSMAVLISKLTSH